MIVYLFKLIDKVLTIWILAPKMSIVLKSTWVSHIAGRHLVLFVVALLYEKLLFSFRARGVNEQWA